MLRAFGLFTLLLALHASGSALAHGAAEANELEVKVLSDEGNDLNDARGGWDVTQVFIGEAHDHALGHGPAGDGVYWRVELYGVPDGSSPLAGGTWSATFSFETDAGPIERHIRTSDGETFETDFDALVTSTSDGVLHVERALVRLAENGLATGMTLRGFRVATFVDEEPRDVAPGGIPLAGPLSLPSPAEDASGEYVLTGPTRYATAALETSGDEPALRVTSLLKKGSQHVHVHLPPGVSSPDPLSVEVKPGASTLFRLSAEGLAEPGATFDVTTDIGGRITAALRTTADAMVLVVDGASSTAALSAPSEPRRVPAAPLALAAIVVALMSRRL